MKKFLAFTLAEVLLTMSVVGVVAAMTIPTLLYQKKQKEYSVKIKNFYSKMNNAINDMQVDQNISFKDMTYTADDNYTTTFNWYMEYIDPYMGHKMIVKQGTQNIYFEDGSSMWVDKMPASDASISLVYDINGSNNGPNVRGRDIFVFSFDFYDSARESRHGHKDIFFGPKAPNTYNNTTRDTIKQKCQNGEDDYNYCTRLLEHDGWEFKKDYPFKL